MAPEMQTTRRETQEQSIKARKNELFEAEARDEGEGVGLRRPFRAYLRETPAAPLSRGVKASLWGTGAVVGLLFVAAIVGGHSTRAKVPTFSAVPATPRPPIVTSSSSPTAARVPAPTPTPRPDKKAEETEGKEKKNAPKPVGIAQAKPPKPEPPKPDGPTPAPAPAQVAAPAPTPTPMPGVAANNATTRPDDTAKPGTATPAEAPKTVQVNPQPAAGPAPTNTAEATPNQPAQKKKSSIFKKKKLPVYSYPKREPRPERKGPLPDLSDPSTSTP